MPDPRQAPRRLKVRLILLKSSLLARLAAAVLFLAPLTPAQADDHGRPVGPWQVEAWGGFLNPDDFTSIMFTPWNTEIRSEGIFGIGAGREVYDFGYGFSLDLGLLAAHRPDEGGYEVGLPATFNYDLPWRETLPMRLRVAIGPSYITTITPTERRKDDDNQGSKLLNMFSPEVEVGLPGAPEFNAFVRLHHRSGIFGLIDGVTGGSTYVTGGVRYRFGIE